MPLANVLRKAAPAIAALGDNPDDYWFLDDIYQRILHGDIEEAYDAVELLEEHLDEHLEDEDEEFPEAAAFAFAEDPEAFTETLAERIWAAAHQTASAWDEKTTDTDRFIDALGELEESGIDAGIYTDFADVEARDGQRGAVVLWVNSWENFDNDNSIEVQIPVANRGDASLTEVTEAVIEAFTEAGLDARPGEDEGFVTVSMQWRHHVATWADAGGSED